MNKLIIFKFAVAFLGILWILLFEVWNPLNRNDYYLSLYRIGFFFMLLVGVLIFRKSEIKKFLFLFSGLSIMIILYLL